MEAWYILQCKSRSEKRAQQNLLMQELETYLPLMHTETKKNGRKSSSSKPLFPNYLFVKFDPEVTSVSRLHSTRGVSRLVGCKENIIPLQQQVIDSIKHRESLGVSPVKVEPAPEPSKGDKVRIHQGALMNLDAIFDEPDGDKRCHVLLDILGQSQRVSIPIKSIMITESS